MLFTNTPYHRYFEIEMSMIPNFKPRCSALRIYEISSVSSYEEAVESLLRDINNPIITARIYKGKRMKRLFRNRDHKEVFWNMIQNSQNCRSQYMAAIFLLSAEKTLWSCAESCVNIFSVDFGGIRLSGATIDSYTLYKAAKEIYTGKPQLTVNELCDEKLIGDETLQTIFNGFLIARNGIEIVNAD